MTILLKIHSEGSHYLDHEYYRVMLNDLRYYRIDYLGTKQGKELNPVDIPNGKQDSIEKSYKQNPDHRS